MFRFKKQTQPQTQAPLRKYKVYCLSSYGTECVVEVMARSREEAAKKVLGPANEARKYLRDDNRDYSINITCVRWVTPIQGGNY